MLVGRSVDVTLACVVFYSIPMDRLYFTIYYPFRVYGCPVYPYTSQDETTAGDVGGTSADQEGHHGRTSRFDCYHNRMDSKSDQLHAKQIRHSRSKQPISLLPYYALYRKQLLESCPLWYIQLTVSKRVYKDLQESIPFRETELV